MKANRMNKMSGPQNQRGMTLLGIATVLAVIGFGALCAIKIGPIYLDNMTIASVIQSEAATPDMRKKTKSQVIKSLTARLVINGLEEYAKEAKIVQKDGQYALVLDYERRINFIANIDVVLVFENSATF